MNQLQKFKNEIFEVSAKFENSEVLFDVEQVARCLGITRMKNDKVYVRWDRLNSYLPKHSPQVGKGDLIPEPLVYKLAFKASNDIAEQFQDWLAIEVLPSIRKHGAYMTPNTINALLQDPDLIIGLASQLKQEQQARQIAEQKNLMLTQQIAENASKITYLDQILRSQDTVTVSQVAADYGLSAMKLNKILNDEKVQYKVNNQWLLYSKHQNKGYTKSKTVDVVHTDGSRSVKMNTRWTQKGRLFIHELLTKRGIIPEMDREAV
ncbi:DNA-binding protein [Bacillus cereus]|uniref:phage antirepressor KilAC domain-containing protein n=1 Tax=Bacillus cereus TaxID=1396 RepID=UPI000BF9839E|nr:phage antirepressor KilAC domain-containing protein [Bacillus cereus]PFS27772.1 DNA-binding protein [Bacillus cereus]